MRSRAILAGAMLLCVVPSLVARAQSASADSTGFRAGQWGAEFSIDGGGAFDGGAHALRFFSDRRALLLGVSGRVYRASGESPMKRAESAISVRVGPRWYRPVRGRVLQYLSVGLLASRERRLNPDYSSSLFPINQSTSTSVGAGAFGEVGGSWMVTPQLSLGAAWQATAQYARVRQGGSRINDTMLVPAESINSWNASFGALALRVGVFF